MKNQQKSLVVWATLISVAIIACAMPATCAQDSYPSQTQSVTGKIASVEKTSFTLSVASAVFVPERRQQLDERTMTFIIAKNTTVDGKLQVGATADVTYRETNGKYLALSVRVQ